MAGQAGYGFPYAYAPSALALAISLAILNIVAVGLRFLSRRRQNVGPGADDWLSVAALIFVLGCASICISGVALGALGYPTPDIALSDPNGYNEVNWAIRITSQCEWAMYIVSVVALGLTKLSFLFFLLRFFSTYAHSRSLFKIAMWVLIGGVICWTMALFVGWLAICGNEPSAFWGPFTGLQRQCGHAYHLLTSTAISDVVFDILIILLPIPMIWNLHLGPRKKFAVTGMFLVGLVVIGASLSRMVLVLESTDTSAGVDEDLYITNTLWWGMFEVGMALLGTCLSGLLPLLPELMGHQNINDDKRTSTKQADIELQNQPALQDTNTGNLE